MHVRNHTSGFTLIELMVTVIIVGILAAIALPAYNQYIRQARISEAVARLADMRVRMEQWFQDNRTYVGGCTNSAISTSFDLVCNAATATTYTINATGVAGTAMADFDYSIDQFNTRTTVSLPTGWNGEGNPCWVLKEGGSC